MILCKKRTNEKKKHDKGMFVKSMLNLYIGVLAMLKYELSDV